ncbi:MAG: D-alanyl-D-alanine carboxypeptidase [Acidobacteria bacterium]|nr:D-alanyl-D-alanine carboxypeptidase [Acidobacteriota bacterium]
MILSNKRGAKPASYLLALAIIAALTFGLPLISEAKSRRSAKSTKVYKHSRSHNHAARGARQGSRSRVAGGARHARGGGKVAMIRVRGRHGKMQWKRVYVARRSASAHGSAHSVGVHNYLTQSWANAQLTPPANAQTNTEMALARPASSLPANTTTDDTLKLNPAASGAQDSTKILVPTQAAPLTEEALPVNPLVAAYASSLNARGHSADNQGFIVSTLSGEILAEHNGDRLFNPASVTKIATTLTAISKLGADFRFRTTLYTDGTFDAATGTLKGSLFLVGSSDPAFFFENAMLIADQLNRSGIHTVEGNLIVLGQFYFNFSASREASAKALRNTWNPESWNAATKAAYQRFLMMRPVDAQSSQMVQPPALQILGEVKTDSYVNTSTLKQLAVHTSLPLVRVLKALNDFSNNWMASAIGNLVGGPDAVQRFLEKEVGFVPEEINIASASGLGSNQISPRGTVRMLRKLVAYLERNHLSLSDLLPVAGIDAGTLQHRFNDAFRGSVVAKTGTLSGVSALAGIAYTRSKGPLLFVIYNRGGAAASFRAAQDETLKKIITLYGGPASVQYSTSGAPRVTERTSESGKSPALINQK